MQTFSRDAPPLGTQVEYIRIWGNNLLVGVQQRESEKRAFVTFNRWLGATSDSPSKINPFLLSTKKFFPSQFDFDEMIKLFIGLLSRKFIYSIRFDRF